MKLILLDDVKALGKSGQVVDVAEGYARNFLVPRKLAIEADKGALAVLESQKKAQAKRDAQTLAEARDLADRLEQSQFAVKAKAGGNGKLFGAVTNADVADAIAQKIDVAIDKHKIEIKSHTNSRGSSPLHLTLPTALVAKATIRGPAA